MNRMRVKTHTLLKYLIYTLIALNIGILKVFNMHEKYITLVLLSNIFFGMILTATCYLNRGISRTIREKCPKAYKTNIIMMLFLGIEIVWTWLAFNANLRMVITNSAYYWCILFFLPLVYVIIKDGEAKVIKQLFFLTCFIQLCRFLSWFSFNFLSASVFPEMIGEYTDLWVRGGYKRMLDTCFVGLELTYAFSIVISGKKNKFIAALAVTMCFVFAFLITASRAMQICCVGVCILMFAFKRGSTGRRFIRWLIIVMLLGVIFNSATFQNLIDGLFNTSSSNYGTTFIRLQAYSYYFDTFLNHWLGGLGFSDGISVFLTQLNHGSAGYYYVSDLGFIGTIFKFGICGLFLVVYTIIIGFNRIKQTTDNENKIFFLGMLLFFGLTGLMSNSVFDMQRIAFYPVLMAIFCYIPRESRT